MCTVTLIKKPNKGFILTSNRDEIINRETLAPKSYRDNDHKLIYPKDMLAGGTWIGMSDNNSMVCLLNGGNDRHISKPPYRLSRGVVVKDLLRAGNLLERLRSFDYQGVEPFTVIAAQWKGEHEFYELVWDGVQSNITSLDASTYIWSSATLYDQNAKKTRELWFNNFLKQKDTSPEKILEFHKIAGQGNKKIGLQIDRGFLKTRSVTQIVKTSQELSMRYEDLTDTNSLVTYCSLKDVSPEVISK
ncbi:NRDE family protein [Aquimarina intermedia]|uniref:Transport and Golgi organization protein 2 n=1 Tax=Aquimarina intermedia TaxID=350814 RepID=A0A5S5CCS4_9FLAO|nr:NRDE family protein [Aquimarina intermedia]TYP75803.1 transport and Golgi organization protein 2 [Aquimarina intermedia]